MTLLTVAETAARLGRSERTVRDQLAAGVMRGQKVGRDWIVELAEVDRYRRDHLGRPGPKAAPATAGKRRRSREKA